jgi:hypothetical protein
LARRSTLKPTGITRHYPRRGHLSQPEKDLIAAVVMDSPREVDARQINGLAKGLRRRRSAIKEAVEQAREIFLGRAPRYVDIHMQTTEAALAAGDPKSLEVAARSSQWAIEHTSADGASIIEKVTEGSSGVKVIIGVKVGGANNVAAE